MELADHEMASERRYRDLKSDIHHLGIDKQVEKESYMSSTPLNIFEGGSGGMGAAMGGGLGAGLLGGILGGALLGGGGLFGRNAGVAEQCVTPMQLQTASGSIIDANQNTTLLQAVGDVKASVPLAAVQTQLSISQTASDMRAHLGQVENTLTVGQASINKNVSDAIAASLQSQNNINVNVLQQGSATRELVNAMGQANLTATKDSQFATQVAISNSTKEILAALNAQNEAGLRSEITALQIRLGEQQADSRARGTEVNVSQTVNQNQLQLQAQQQQQQQAILLNNLCNLVGGLQNAVATNSNLIVGNTGAVATGPQTANPVNVRA